MEPELKEMLIEILSGTKATLEHLQRLTHLIESRLFPSYPVSVKEAARHLKKRPETIRRWCKDGLLRHKKIGRAYEVYLSEQSPVSAA